MVEPKVENVATSPMKTKRNGEKTSSLRSPALSPSFRRKKNLIKKILDKSSRLVRNNLSFNNRRVVSNNRKQDITQVPKQEQIVPPVSSKSSVIMRPSGELTRRSHLNHINNFSGYRNNINSKVSTVDCGQDNEQAMADTKLITNQRNVGKGIINDHCYTSMWWPQVLVTNYNGILMIRFLHILQAVQNLKK